MPRLEPRPSRPDRLHSTTLLPAPPSFHLLPGCKCPPTSHIIHTQHTHEHTPQPAPHPPPKPPHRSPVTLPGTRQVVGAERARECQPTAKGPLPAGTQLTGALSQCRAQCTHEDNRPAHMLVLMYMRGPFTTACSTPYLNFASNPKTRHLRSRGAAKITSNQL